MPDTDNVGIVVLGAGLAGLGCARVLKNARIYEALPYAGGHAHSHSAGGFFFDEGAHICHSRDKRYLDLIYSSAGAVHQIYSSRVVNRRQGQWLTYPVHNHLHELNPEERIRALAGFVEAKIKPSESEPKNYREWCSGNYGEFLTENFYAEYTAKYWRVPMESLGTDWLSGRLLPSQIQRVIAGAIAPQPETQAVFAQFHYPERGGYFSFYRKLFEQWPISFNHRAQEIDWRRRIIRFQNGETTNYESLASSLPLPMLAGMLNDAPVTVKEAAEKLCHTKLLCVNLVINRPCLVDFHWFYIYDRDIEASRVSVASNLGRESAAQSATALQAEIFRRADEDMPVDALVEHTVQKLAALLGFTRDEVIAVSPVVVPYAYVISDLNRAAAVEYLLGWLREQRIFSMGLFGKWKYIWSDAAFRDGEETALTIKKNNHI